MEEVVCPHRGRVSESPFYSFTWRTPVSGSRCTTERRRLEPRSRQRRPRFLLGIAQPFGSRGKTSAVCWNVRLRDAVGVPALRDAVGVPALPRDGLPGAVAVAWSTGVDGARLPRELAGRTCRRARLSRPSLFCRCRLVVTPSGLNVTPTPGPDPSSLDRTGNPLGGDLKGEFIM